LIELEIRFEMGVFSIEKKENREEKIDLSRKRKNIHG